MADSLTCHRALRSRGKPLLTTAPVTLTTIDNHPHWYILVGVGGGVNGRFTSRRARHPLARVGDRLGTRAGTRQAVLSRVGGIWVIAI